MKVDDLVEETMRDQVGQGQYYGDVYLPDFARDVVMYGRTDINGVLTAFNVTPEDFAKIAKMPLFKALVGNLKKKLADSDNIGIQMKAADLLDATLLVMQSRLLSGEMKNKELVDMAKFLVDVTGAKVVEGKAGDIIGPVNTGTVVKINYGMDLEKMPMLPADAPVNETYKKVEHLFDTKQQIIDVDAD